ncbi:IclR family transcriptional regulator [Martelella sp. HB161492]|uniref:IclR family transcriptional regulator n=1 Tax=Martelella sp. HB161492 TaxID=2720726 RepID=UPI001590D74F|nr:IclR family transcriptional regulator [Martelella sp. HB161492]
MDRNTFGYPATPRRIEPADITTDKTQVVLDGGERPRDEKDDQPGAGAGNGEGVTIQSVDRALSILEYIAAATEPLKLQDIAQDLNLKTPTCYHLLNSLVKRGFVTRNAHPRTYHLGPRIGEMARQGSAHFDIRRAALPHLMALRDQIGHTVCMAVFSGTELTIAAEAGRADGVSLSNYQTQFAAAAHATALGKAILAWLPEPEIARVVADRGLTGFTDLTMVSLGDLVESLRQVRRHGFAVDTGEFRLNVISLAVALRDPGGGVIGSLGCLLPRDGDDLSMLRDIRSQVSTAAKAVSELLR